VSCDIDAAAAADDDDDDDDVDRAVLVFPEVICHAVVGEVFMPHCHRRSHYPLHASVHSVYLCLSVQAYHSVKRSPDGQGLAVIGGT